MREIGQQLDDATRAFDFSREHHQPAILDMCMAPGGFVAVVLDKYPTARARAMSLPVQQGGHVVLLKYKNINLHFVDITTLADDMDLLEADIPPSHPEAGSFKIQKQISEDEKFDLVLCDGQVLRTQIRAQWRESREARRLILTQLVLGLEHIRPGNEVGLPRREALGSSSGKLPLLARMTTVGTHFVRAALTPWRFWRTLEKGLCKWENRYGRLMQSPLVEHHI